MEFLLEWHQYSYHWHIFGDDPGTKVRMYNRGRMFRYILDNIGKLDSYTNTIGEHIGFTQRQFSMCWSSGYLYSHTNQWGNFPGIPMVPEQYQ